MNAAALVLLLALPDVSSGAPPEPLPPHLRLSLQQAFERAVAANAAVGRARAEVDAAAAQRRGAFSLLLPRVQATSSLIRNDREVSFGSGEDARVVLPAKDWNVRLTLSQPVFAGLREKRAYDQSKQGLEASRDGLRGTEERVLLEVAADFLSLAQAEALIEVERQSVELAAARRRQARDFLEAGESTRVDLLRAETALKAAERRLAAAQQQREHAAGQLRVELDLQGEIEVEAPAGFGTTAASEAELKQRAELRRPELAQARSALRIAELEVSKQAGGYFPVVTADAGYVWQKTAFPTTRFGFAALRFTLPLFQSGETGARVALARERERQARSNFEEAVRRVHEDVRQALVEERTTALTLALAEEQLAAAEAEYGQVSELYRSQEATSLDVQSAETELADARRAVASGRLDLVLASLKVRFAAGELKASVLKEVLP